MPLLLAAFVLLLVGGQVPLQADSLTTSDPDTALTATISLPDSSANEMLPASPEPFRRGEVLRFSVQYGFINAGSAYLEVSNITDYNGHPVYTLVARAESNAFFSRF
mgnify:CR=1 FL=1